MPDDLSLPFDSLESALEYMALLNSAIGDSRRDVARQVEAAAHEPAARRLEALRLVHLKLTQLEQHVEASHRLLNDLRTLERLLLGKRAGDSADAEA